MATRTVAGEAQQVRIAIELIEMGARLQLLQEETSLNRERLLRLYKEIKGESPSRGMLPYSTDWFMGWQPNIHSSLFMGIYEFLLKHAGIGGIQGLISAYRLYLDQIQWIEGGLCQRQSELRSNQNNEPVLSITRAWSLIRFFRAEMLQLVVCRECGGRFVAHTNDLHDNYVCGICHPPARAGKTSAAKQEAAARAA